MKLKLAIFDLDGTLFDTNDVNFYAYKESLATLDVILEREFFINECMGKHYSEFLPQLINSAEDVERVHQLKKELYAQHVNKARMNCHLFTLIKAIKEQCHIAIVTTASRKNTEEILKHFECEELFDCILTQDEIEKKKPNPQGFIMAMDYFGVNPEDTVIYEDSKSGVEAARLSGATVFVVDRF